jgi:hypothetical protein
MDGKPLATMDDGTTEAAVFQTSYGYLVRVRHSVDHDTLGTKPFRELADAMAYAELLTKHPKSPDWEHWAAYNGELAILFSHQRCGDRVGFLDTLGQRPGARTSPTCTRRGRAVPLSTPCPR